MSEWGVTVHELQPGPVEKVQYAVLPSFVKLMLGGAWPEDVLGYEGFYFDSVDHYRVEDGCFVPYDGDSPVPGPDSKLNPVEAPHWMIQGIEEAGE